MRKELTQTPKVGDTIYYVGSSHNYLTRDEGYKVRDIDEDGDAVIYDDDGDREYISRSSYPNFEIENEVPEDPGYFEVHSAFDEGDDLQVVEVTVDRKGYDMLVTLEKQHNKATRAEVIQRQIAELQKELKSL